MNLTLSPVFCPDDTAPAFEDMPDTLESLTLGSGAIVVMDTMTGEIVSEQDAPADSAEIADIADYIGRRRLQSQARIAGLKAELDFIITQAHMKFDPQIKQEERYVAYLETKWYDRLRQFALEALLGKKTKTHRIGLLELKFSKTRASTTVTDPATAVLWAESYCPEAVKKSVLVSAIPDILKAAGRLKPEAAEFTGISHYPGGEEKFEVK